MNTEQAIKDVAKTLLEVVLPGNSLMVANALVIVEVVRPNGTTTTVHLSTLRANPALRMALLMPDLLTAGVSILETMMEVNAETRPDGIDLEDGEDTDDRP